MALKKSTTTETTTTTSFEQEPDMNTSVIDRPEPTPAPAPAADAAVSATTAIAKAATSSLSTNDAAKLAKSFKKEVADMQDAADLSYGNFRTFKAKDGVIKEMNGEKLKLGRWVKVHLMAWSRHFEISPGEDGASSSNYVAYSKDGQTIDHILGEDMKSWEGKAVSDYLDHLRDTEDFDKATKREFIDTQCAVLGCEDEPEFNEIIQITLSSSSIPAFKSYQSQLEAKARCVEMGLPGHELPASPFQFYFIREDASKGKNSWTKLRIASNLPAKI